MDRITEAQRSANMSRVKGKDTRPELAVRRIAHKLGLRFRLHRRDLPGSPDLVFPKYRLAVFVHGCFWHRHAGCRRASNPATRADFWQKKFDSNVTRDRRQEDALAALGWNVLTIWECEVKSPESVAAALLGATKLQSD